MVCLWLCMYNQITPANRAQGYIFVYYPKVAAKTNKQTRGKTHTPNLLACVPFGTGMKRAQLKSAILVSQVPEEFFARVKVGSLRVHVVLVNFIGE